MQVQRVYIQNWESFETTEDLNILLNFRVYDCPTQSQFGFCSMQQLTQNGYERAHHDCFYSHCFEDKRRVPILENNKEAYLPSMCNHYNRKNGHCKYGKKCKYCHTALELLFHPEIYRTKMCQYIVKNQNCPAGKYCCYAHSFNELRSRPPVCNIPINSIYRCRGCEDIIPTQLTENNIDMIYANEYNAQGPPIPIQIANNQNDIYQQRCDNRIQSLLCHFSDFGPITHEEQWLIM